MDTRYETLLRCRDAVRARTDFVPRVALVLGSGLGDLAGEIELAAAVDYADLPDFPVSTVQGHEGRFLFGRLAGVDVVCMQGRVHYYEGYSVDQVVLPVRLMGMLGAGTLFLTNAAGGLRPEWDAGELMLITDHMLTFFPANPLRGPNLEELGTRFPDMSHVYDPALCNIIRGVAADQQFRLREGVYVQLPGPSYETPAEVHFLGNMGGSAVGMSTAVEAVAARHMGLRVCGISCITNKGAGISQMPLSHEEVKQTADMVGARFRALVTESIRRMAQTL